MTNIADVDMTLYFHRKHTPPHSVLLLQTPNNKDQRYYIDSKNKSRSHQQKTRYPPHMIGLHVSNLDIHDTSSSSFGWQRHTDKISQITLAPDIVYRNTYSEETKRDNNKHRSLSPRLNLNNSFSCFPSESSQQRKHHSHQNQNRTIYDSIRDSIRQIEQQRNLKQSNLSSRVQRPQNEDSTFRRVLREKRSSAKTSLSRTTTQTISSIFNNGLKSPQSFVNYMNYSRVFHSPTPDQSYEQRSILSQN